MKLAGWTMDNSTFRSRGLRQNAHAHVLPDECPGIPCIYGDEIADVGGNDPDNRRMMRFDKLNDDERATKAWTAEWARLRTTRMSMLYGTTAFNILNEDVLLIERSYLGEATHVLLNCSGKQVAIPEMAVQPKALLAGFLTDKQGGLPGHGAVAFSPQPALKISMKHLFLYFFASIALALTTCVVGLAQPTWTLDETVLNEYTLVSGVNIPWELTWGQTTCSVHKLEGDVPRIDPASGAYDTVLELNVNDSGTEPDCWYGPSSQLMTPQKCIWSTRHLATPND